MVTTKSFSLSDEQIIEIAKRTGATLEEVIAKTTTKEFCYVSKLPTTVLKWVYRQALGANTFPPRNEMIKALSLIGCTLVKKTRTGNYTSYWCLIINNKYL